MRIISIIVILLPVIAYFSTSKKKDFLNPAIAFTVLYILKIVIPTIVYSYLPNVPIAGYFFLEASLYDDEVFFKYTIVQSIGYCMVLCGISMIKIKKRRATMGKSTDRLKSRRYKICGYFFYLLGVIGFVMVMSKTGGIVYFLSNIGRRIEMIKDLDFETKLLSLLNYAPLILVYSKRWTKDKIRLLDIILIVLAGLMVGLGGRKALIMLLIESVAIYHFVVKPIKIKRFLNVKVISISCMVLIFFTTYSKLRRPGAFDEFVKDPIGFYLMSNEGGLTNSLVSESYVPFYVSIVDYFDKHDKWEGASFFSLPSAFIPSSFYPNKPPVDDGMYLYSIAHGTNVHPPMPTRELDGSSWPLETFGAMYANFGSVGVILGMLLLGCVISYSFKRMVLSNYQFKYVILYIVTLFTFEISTLRIVQLVTIFITLSFIQFVIEKKYD